MADQKPEGEELLDPLAQDGNGGAPPASSRAGGGLPPEFFASPKSRVTLLQCVVALNTFVLLGVLAAVLLWPAGRGRQQIIIQRPVAVAPGPAGPTPPAPPAAVVPEGCSWRTAERAYADRRWADSLAQYQQLLAAAEGNSQDELVADFLRLREAQCELNLGGKASEAPAGLTAAAKSRSPAVRGVALLQMASVDAAAGQYLKARTNAYRAVGALSVAGLPPSLQAACDSVVAETLARKALSFFGDGDLLPGRAAGADPFAGIKSEEALRAVLAAGTERLAAAALGPRIAVEQKEKVGPRWTVTSAGAPLEEVLCRIAGGSDLDIAWGAIEPAARQRPLEIALTDETDHRVTEVACGAVGLVARLTGTRVVVHDPAAVASASDLRDLLLAEAVSAWRRVLLRDADPDRLAYAHFALGVLCEQQADKAAAMVEYRVLVQRYPRSPLTAPSRLQSAGVRIELRDYLGARSDLLDLLDQQPNYPRCDAVYLRLGQATMEAGLFDEAAQTFKKLYFCELSAASQVGAAFGAATCFYRKGDMAEAATWFKRYLDLAGKTEDPRADQGNHLLAKCLLAQGKPAEAAVALRRVVNGHPPAALRAEAMVDLARTLAGQGEYTAALAVIEEINGGTVTPAVADETVILQARTLRLIGLPERGLRLLRGRQEAASSLPARVAMEVELARCYAAMGDREGARQHLTQALPHLEAGPLAWQAAMDLAQIHLDANRSAQAVSLYQGLLAQALPDDVRRRVLAALGGVYLRDRDYVRAALVLAGKTAEPEGAARP